jgi:hypothetical protein
MATTPQTNNRQKDFIAEIKTQGIARTNRFTVDFSPPKAVPAQTKRMLLFCEKAQLPGINFATTANRTYGESREVVYDRMFEPITLTFHVDRQMTVKNIFDTWSQYIINPVNRSVGWYSEYVTPMTIRIQDVEDRVTYLVQLYEAYPKSISGISLNAEDNNDTMRLDVTFQYKYWYATMIEQDPYTNLEKTSGGLKGYLDDFTGFQQKYLKGLGEAGNFLTGAVGQYAMRGFSSVTSRIPSIKF